MAHAPENINRGLPGWLKVVIILVVALCLLLGTVYVLGLGATRRWNQLVRRLHEKGQPVTLREIESRRPIIPDDENLARQIEIIFESYETLPGDKPIDSNVFVFTKHSPDFFNGVERDCIAPSREYVNRLEPILFDLPKLMNFESGRFPLDLSQPALMMLIPHVGPLRRLGDFSRLAATLALIDGRVEDAGQQVLIQLHLARSLDGEPVVISRLVQMATENTAALTLEDTLRVGELPPDQLDAVKSSLHERLNAATIHTALLGERACFVDTCESILTGRLTPPNLMSITGFANPVLMNLPRLPAWVVRVNQLKGTEMLTLLVNAGDNLDELQAAVSRLDVEIPKLSAAKFPLARIMLPSLSRAITLHIKTIAKLRAAAAAVAAEHFRLDRGRLPESFGELVPDYLESVPVDPFDNQPLRFVKTGEGIVIYSIDENMFDDGGDVDRGKYKGRTPDVGFRLLRPEHRGLRIIDSPASEESEP